VASVSANAASWAKLRADTVAGSDQRIANDVASEATPFRTSVSGREARASVTLMTDSMLSSAEDRLARYTQRVAERPSALHTSPTLLTAYARIS